MSAQPLSPGQPRDIDTRCLTKMVAENAAVDKDIADFVKARMKKRTGSYADGRAKRSASAKILPARWTACESENTLQFRFGDQIMRHSCADVSSRFRWVACRLDALLEYRSENELLHAPTTLPKTFETPHERILALIEVKDRRECLCTAALARLHKAVGSSGEEDCLDLVNRDRSCSSQKCKVL